MRKLRKALGATALALLILGLLFAGRVWWLLQPRQDPQPLPAGLVSLAGPQGREMLSDADAFADYALLSAKFESQKYRSYCGVASSVTVLSALGKDVDQGSFFTGNAGRVRSRLEVLTGGMTLEDLAALLRAHGAAVAVRHADAFDLDQFRTTVAENLARPDDYLLVNYQREVLGQRRLGHISPLAAYDRDTDSVLIMDTATYSYPPTWVPLARLYAAMQTTDSSSGKLRGYVEVSGPASDTGTSGTN
jgi:hypothetical protein